MSALKVHLLVNSCSLLIRLLLFVLRNYTCYLKCWGVVLDLFNHKEERNDGATFNLAL